MQKCAIYLFNSMALKICFTWRKSDRTTTKKLVYFLNEIASLVWRGHLWCWLYFICFCYIVNYMVATTMSDSLYYNVWAHLTCNTYPIKRKPNAILNSGSQHCNVCGLLVRSRRLYDNFNNFSSIKCRCIGNISQFIYRRL